MPASGLRARFLRCAERVRARSGTTFVRVLIGADEPPRALPPRDGVANKIAFRAALGLPTF